jgi:hypothetical protein
MQNEKCKMKNGKIEQSPMENNKCGMVDAKNVDAE